MRRVIALRTCTFRSCSFRAGHYYALPEEFSESMISANLAYWEDEDPPFDDLTIEVWERPFKAQADNRKRLADLQASRARAKKQAQEEAERKQEEILARAAALRATRRAAKGNN